MGKQSVRKNSHNFRKGIKITLHIPHGPHVDSMERIDHKYFPRRREWPQEAQVYQQTSGMGQNWGGAVHGSHAIK